jgi:hypothetical protein
MQKRSLLVGLFLLFSFSSLAQYQFERTKKAVVDKQQFEYLIADSDSVEAALERLHSVYPNLFDLYLLSYHSRSLQGSSPLKPRAIVFDPSGHFVMSFNGDRTQRGGNAIEIMRFLPEQRRFEFQEVVFEDGQEVGPKFSQVNPPKCMVCHQALGRESNDPRPNWEPYNFWPGFYGSADGFLGRKKYQIRNSAVSEDEFLVSGIESEESNLKQFLDEVKADHSRYRFLGEFEPRLTVDFTELMARRNFSRIHRLISEEQSEIFEAIEPTFYGALKCGRLMISNHDYQWLRQLMPDQEPIYRERRRSDVPPPTREGVRNRLLRDRFSVMDLSDEEFELTVERVYQGALREQQDYMKVDVSEFLHDLFEPLGVSTSDWSMDFRTQGRFAAIERFGTPSNTRDRFRDAIRNHMGTKAFNELPSCDELRELSPVAFSNFRNSDLVQKLLLRKQQNSLREERPLVQRCQRCHDGRDAEVPFIPFADESRLAAWLDRPLSAGSLTLRQDIERRMSIHAKDSERMPLGPVPTESQRLQFLEFIEGL